MADIFISYSKVDRLLVEQLAAYLEREGWSVWWDKSLSAGNAYRDEIMRELLQARAVVAVWSESSIKSDWVRAEAGRAKVQGKLIPVKTASVSYGNIPLPFGEMHTELVDNRALIRAAVKAQLDKPEAAAPRLSTATAAIKYQALMWFGIVGGAITLFTNLKGIVQLSDWARLLVKYWLNITQFAWDWLFALIGISVPVQLVPCLNIFFFLFATAFSAYRAGQIGSLNSGAAAEMPTLASGRPGLKIAAVVVWALAPLGLFVEPDPRYEQIWAGLALLIVVIGYVLLFGASRNRLAVLGFLSLYAFVIHIMNSGLTPENRTVKFSEFNIPFVWLGLFSIGSAAIPLVLSLVPIQQINRRMLFVLVGCGVLLGFNELAKLDLAQYLIDRVR